MAERAQDVRASSRSLSRSSKPFSKKQEFGILKQVISKDAQVKGALDKLSSKERSRILTGTIRAARSRYARAGILPMREEVVEDFKSAGHIRSDIHHEVRAMLSEALRQKLRLPSPHKLETELVAATVAGNANDHMAAGGETQATKSGNDKTAKKGATFDKFTSAWLERGDREIEEAFAVAAIGGDDFSDLNEDFMDSSVPMLDLSDFKLMPPRYMNVLFPSKPENLIETEAIDLGNGERRFTPIFMNGKNVMNGKDYDYKIPTLWAQMTDGAKKLIHGARDAIRNLFTKKPKIVKPEREEDTLVIRRPGSAIRKLAFSVGMTAAAIGAYNLDQRGNLNLKIDQAQTSIAGSSSEQNIGEGCYVENNGSQNGCYTETAVSESTQSAQSTQPEFSVQPSAEPSVPRATAERAPVTPSKKVYPGWHANADLQTISKYYRGNAQRLLGKKSFIDIVRIDPGAAKFLKIQDLKKIDYTVQIPSKKEQRQGISQGEDPAKWTLGYILDQALQTEVYDLKQRKKEVAIIEDTLAANAAISKNPSERININRMRAKSTVQIKDGILTITQKDGKRQELPLRTALVMH